MAAPRGYESFNQFTPEQQQVFKGQFGQLGPDSYTSRLAAGDPQLLDQLDQQDLREFGGIQGGIASRFSAMGRGGQKSSGFRNTMDRATQDFASDMQQRRQKMRMDAIRDLMGMSNQVLGQQQNVYMPKKGNWFQNLISKIGGSYAEGLGDRLMGGM